MKQLAEKHKNSWHLAFFSCCRELYNHELKHKNGLPGPRAAAEACLAARALAIEQKKIEEAKYTSNLKAANAKIAELEE